MVDFYFLNACQKLKGWSQTLPELQNNGPSIGVLVSLEQKMVTEVKMAAGVKVISVMLPLLGFSAGLSMATKWVPHICGSAQYAQE